MALGKLLAGWRTFFLADCAYAGSLADRSRILEHHWCSRENDHILDLPDGCFVGWVDSLLV